MKVNIKDIIKPTQKKRFLFFLLSDILVFSLSLYLSLLLRFDFNINHIQQTKYFRELLRTWIPIVVILKIAIFYLNKLYFISWKFVSVEEFFRISISLLISTVLLTAISHVTYFLKGLYLIPRSIIITDFFISLVLTSLLRISKRLYLERIKRVDITGIKKALIIGAGSTGERIARELLSDKEKKLYPVGFLDDDDNKLGVYIHNIKVLGKIDDLDRILKNYEIDSLIIAIPSLSYKKIKKIYETARANSIDSIKIMPDFSKLPDEFINIKDLREIRIEDLLARKPVSIDEKEVFSFIRDKIVFVSGAAGSIGSEIVMQLLKFNPKKIIAYEIDETELFNLERKVSQVLANTGKNIAIDYIVGDIKDERKLEHLFRGSDVEVVFHAAAYKHVPLMEFFPEEAVKTNIFGTYTLVKTSIKYGVEKFINISTDKAVNPTSIMGATKRMAEMICRAHNSIGPTKFISVRFGNVLGSRGSVIPIFLDQIKNGGPLTVTHPDIKRYFMTIPEAVLLVFQAAAMGKGGEVFVLDMGEPVKIVQLAEELIKLNGLKPYEDIDIIFTGLRPGEKLFEELLTAEEGTVASKHSKIFIARAEHVNSVEEIEIYIKELKAIVEHGNYEALKNKLKEIVPFYEGKGRSLKRQGM